MPHLGSDLQVLQNLFRAQLVGTSDQATHLCMEAAPCHVPPRVRLGGTPRPHLPTFVEFSHGTSHSFLEHNVVEGRGRNTYVYIHRRQGQMGPRYGWPPNRTRPAGLTFALRELPDEEEILGPPRELRPQLNERVPDDVIAVEYDGARGTQVHGDDVTIPASTHW